MESYELFIMPLYVAFGDHAKQFPSLMLQESPDDVQTQHAQDPIRNPHRPDRVQMAPFALFRKSHQQRIVPPVIGPKQNKNVVRKCPFARSMANGAPSITKNQQLQANANRL